MAAYVSVRPHALEAHVMLGSAMGLYLVSMNELLAHNLYRAVVGKFLHWKDLPASHLGMENCKVLLDHVPPHWAAA